MNSILQYLLVFLIACEANIIKDSDRDTKTTLRRRRATEEGNSTEDSEDAPEIFQGEIVTSRSEIPAFALLCPSGCFSCGGCGGVLISDQHVLTAAHCVEDDGVLTPPTGVRIGALTRSDGEYVTVTNTVAHPSYFTSGGASSGYDIAVLTLGTRCESTTPLGYNVNTGYPTGTSTVAVTAYGFGGIDSDQTQSSVLRKLSTRIQTDAFCESMWSRFVPSLQVCIRSDVSGSYRGDSGGPIVDDVYGLLLGIDSYGTGNCGNGYVSVWTDPAGHADWIASQIQSRTVPTRTSAVGMVKSIWERSIAFFGY